jgi:hypothetical protein
MKECFGTIYPDLTQFRFGKQMVGKVFQLKIDTFGPFQRDRNFETDIPAWDECQRCELYRSCYDFSTGKFLMQQFLIQV